MEKEYKIIEEIKKIYNNKIEFKIEETKYPTIKWLKIENLYTIDKDTIEIINKYANDYYINTDHKKAGLIINIQIWKENIN